MINLREWALPVYTIMMQLAAGGMVIFWLIYTGIARRYGHATADRVGHNLVMFIFLTVTTAMIGSHFHLSRPLHSLLALRNFYSSWLSREIAFTIVFAFLVGVLWLMQRAQRGSYPVQQIIGWSAGGMGLLTVYCMSHVYLLPTQVAWNSITTPVAFFSATFLLGGLAVSALLLMNLYIVGLREAGNPAMDRHIVIIQRILEAATLVAVAAAITELVNYGVQIRSLADGGTSARASLDLLLGLYSVMFGIRLGVLVFGVLILVGVVVWQRSTGQPLVRLLTPVYAIFLLLLVGEVLGRFLFYAIHVRMGI